uniref:Uncharacterized protein n=1 Tax=viral metagenome TaxID=1070528 RepID=A0A6M3IHI4_9ZZZZ
MHKYDPCIYCGVAHDDVERGPCPGNKSQKEIKNMFDKMNDYDMLPKGEQKEIEPENIC